MTEPPSVRLISPTTSKRVSSTCEFEQFSPGGLGKGTDAAGPDAARPVQQVHASRCL